MHAIRLLCCLCAMNVLCGTAFAQQNPDGRLPVFQYSEPYPLLIRDPEVHRELQLSQGQQRDIDALNKELDGPLWSTRNQSAEKGQQILQDLMADSRTRLAGILDPSQLRRLQEIEYRVLGLRSLLRKEVMEQLQLSDAQRKKIQKAVDSYQSEHQKLLEQVQAGQPLEPLEKKNTQLLTDAQKQVQDAMKPDQRSRWQVLLGKPINSNEIGFAKLSAPELKGEGPWVNSSPLTLRGLRGKVVVLHFWTFGCINCIHNYPSYHNWLEEFSGQDVVILGIHTPEVASERNFETLQRKATENKLTFPILVDNDSANWNAWGNSMWPAVYLVDKKGDVRYWWLGELNWQGQAGEKIFRQRITELLKEDVP